MTGLTDSIRLLQLKISCLFFLLSCLSLILFESFPSSCCEQSPLNCSQVTVVTCFREFCDWWKGVEWLLILRLSFYPCELDLSVLLYEDKDAIRLWCSWPFCVMKSILYPWHDMPVLLILSSSFIKSVVWSSLFIGTKSVYANLNRASQMSLILAFEMKCCCLVIATQSS